MATHHDALPPALVVAVKLEAKFDLPSHRIQAPIRNARVRQRDLFHLCWRLYDSGHLRMKRACVQGYMHRAP